MDDFFSPDFLIDAPKVGHYLSIFTFLYKLCAEQDDAQSQKVCISFPILVREDAFPKPEGLKHLEFLGEEESYPPKAIKERVDFEFVQLLPSLRVQGQKHRVDIPHPTVNWVFLFAEISHVHLQYIAHHIVEHKETSSLLNWGRGVPVGVDKIENGS